MKLKFTIEGMRVHNVGYRSFLIDLADEFGIQKFAVHNSVEEDKQLVIAKAEADEDQLTAFMDAMRRRRPEKAEVLDIRHEPFEGRIPSIIRTSMLNTNAQLAKWIAAIESIDEKLGNMDEKLG